MTSTVARFLSVLAGTALLGLAGCSTGNGGAADGGSAGAAELGDDLLAQIKGRGEMIFCHRGHLEPLDVPQRGG